MTKNSENTKKLRLAKETVRCLDDAKLAGVAGGRIRGSAPSDCIFC